MRRRTILGIAAGLAILPGLALAADPAPLELSLTAEIAAEPAEVWAAIGNFQDMSWHPAVFSNEGEGGNDVGATRVLTLGQEGGPTISEELTAYDAEKMSYAYNITDVAMDVLPVTDYSSVLTVSPRDGGGSVVAWEGTFHRGDPGADPSKDLDDEAAIAAVTGVYQAGLDALVEQFGKPAS